MAKIENLRVYAQNPNVRQFLDVIAQAEGTTGYDTAFGGGKIADLSAHPRTLHSFTQTDGKRNKTSAAGRYQFLSKTWDDVSSDLGLPDFGPESQDLAAVELLRRNGALEPLLSGDFNTAIEKSGTTWASLPSSPYPQKKRSAGFMAAALDNAAKAMLPAANASQEQPQKTGQSMKERIEKAKAAGFTDQEIMSRIQSNPDMAARIDKARQAGFTDEEIFGRLGISKSSNQAPMPEPQPEQPTGGGIGQGFMMGLQDPIDAGAQMLRRAVPEGVGQAVDRFGNWLSGMGFPVSPSNGVEGIDRAINERNQQYEQARVAQGRGGMDWARLGGNVAALAPAFAALPAGGPTLLGRTLVGGVTGAGAGALSPVVGEQNQQDFMGEKGGQALLGGAFGAAAAPVMSGLSRLVSPRASQPGSAPKILQSEGVQLTPGQALGGTLMRTEDKLMSIPILGDAIRGARGRANEQLNRAVYNRVLDPLGKTTAKTGREAVDDVSRIVSQSYDDVLGKMQFVPDQQFADDILRLQRMANELPAKEAKVFRDTLQKEVIGPLTKGRAADGMTFKRVEEQLGTRAQQFLKSTDAYQNDVGRALIEVQKSLRDSLARMNPQHAQELRNVNAAFANLTRLQTAAGKIGAQEGIFTPQQLAQAIRTGDMTVRKNQYARGNALMQDLSDAAQSRMSAQIPNSGTTDRALLNLGTLGAGYYNPFIPAGLVAASIPYLPGAVRAATGSIVNRPAGANRLADLLRRLPAGAAGVLAGQ